MPVDVDAVVLSNERLSDAYNVVALAAPEIAVRCQPGQFVMVKRGLGSEPLLRRPFSVFEILRNDRHTVTGLSLLNKRVGTVTRELFALQAGERFRCLGPLGRPFSTVEPPRGAWMVAGGVGLAPFVTLAEALHAEGTATTLFYGGRSADELFYLSFFERLGVRIVLTTEDGSRGEASSVTGPLERELKTTSPKTPLMIYACGPTAMMRAVADLGATYHQPAEVSLEPVMGCGLGGCYSCVVRIRADGAAGRFVRACLDGPVFSADRILWDELAS